MGQDTHVDDAETVPEPYSVQLAFRSKTSGVQDMNQTRSIILDICTAT